MSTEALDLFGRLLMKNVRDETISDWKSIVGNRMKGERAARIQSMVSAFSPDERQVLLSLVPEVVDSVLHHLLWMLEQSDDVRVGVSVENKSTPDLKAASDGLAGELYSAEGWIARFSQER